MALLYEFGEFRLDPKRRLLVNGNGEPLYLTPRAFDALLLMVRHAGELIGKETLMKALWPNVVVSDNSLDQIVSRLRRALGWSTSGSPFIVTERGRGYRLVANVKVSQTADTSLDYLAVPPRTTEAGQVGAPPQESRAYQLYLQSRALSNRPSPDNLNAACTLLQGAIDRDPGFVQALAHLALIRTVLVAFDHASAETLEAAESDARRALEAAPELARGHQAMGNICVARGAWNEAHRHFDAACRSEDDPDARVTRIWQLRQPVGHLHLAREEALSIELLVPSQPLGAIAAALASLLLGLDSEASSHADMAEELGWPGVHPVLRDIRAQLAIRAGSFTEASEHICSSLSTPLLVAGMQAFKLGCASLADPSLKDTAIQAFGALTAKGSATALGIVDRRRVLLWLVMLGALDDAFAFANASLDQFASSGTIGIQWGMLWMPEMRPFRRDHRFHGIIRRLRLVDYWRRHGPPDGHELRNGMLVALS